jgi:hypothetical protein
MSEQTTPEQPVKTTKKKRANMSNSKNEDTRPDPFFKRITLAIAHRLGLKIINAEFPQTLRGDNILGVPSTVDLSKTAYHFFMAYNVIEFKGADDSLTEFKYIINEIRTNLLILNENVKDADFDNTLNLIVCARYPERFFAFMKDKSHEFTSDATHKWLYRRKVGLQNVAIVVLRDMPLDEKYYEWLRLAPTDSPIWKELVKIAFRQQDWELLRDLWDLNHEVVEMTAQELDEVMSEMSPERLKRYLQHQAAGVKLSLAKLKTHPEEFQEAISDIEPEQLVDALDPNEEEKLLQLLLKKRQERERQIQQQAATQQPDAAQEPEESKE